MTTYNLSRFDLVTVRLVVRASQLGSLTKAAEEAHLATSAASRRLRDLESTVGSPLFSRHARGIVTTAAGRTFVKHGINLLQTLTQLDGELNDLKQGAVRHLRLCASTAAVDQFLPQLLADHARTYPKVIIELEEQVSGGVVNALREGRADVGVLVEGLDTRGLETRIFRKDELVLVLPAGHRLARARTPLWFDDVLDEQWIGLTTGASLLQQQQQAAFASQRPLKLRMQVRSFDAVCHLVAAGLGVALLPKGAALPLVRALKLAWRPLTDSWARRRLLVAVVAGTTDLAIEAFVDFLTDASPTANGERS
jgi:DNA-binding transcriptional LysR family regulator